MSKGINKVILVGHFGKDPEVKYLPSGTGVCNTTMATSESYKDKESGEWKERTEWHNVVFFGKTAEVVGEHLRKGSHVYVEGSLRTRKWQDKNGHDRYTTEVVARELLMLGKKSSEDSEARPAAAPAPRATATAPHSPPSTPETGDSIEEDDIPFN